MGRVLQNIRSHLRHGNTCSQSGFTVVELLVAMASGLVVVAGLLAFIIVSLDMQNAITSRTASTTQGELGATQFERDLREAQNIPVAASAANPFGNLTPLIITYSEGASAGFTASFHIPSITQGGGAASAPSAGQAVTWTCTAASAHMPGSCTRTVGGVTRMEIPNLLAATITPQSATGHPLPTATLVEGVPTPPGSPSEFPSYVAVSFQLEVISQNDAARSQVLRGVANPIVIQAGVDIRSYS
jgi:type II secretory pathway pseudopilin PulG